MEEKIKQLVEKIKQLEGNKISTNDDLYIVLLTGYEVLNENLIISEQKNKQLEEEIKQINNWIKKL